MKNLRYEARRAAIARSLLELEKQFGRKPPDKKSDALREQGEAGQASELPAHDSTALKQAQGGRHD
jgi:hypothetical protein